ncbi:MAG TPA: DUF4166 domain-containing protein [Sphingomonas sp.]
MASVADAILDRGFDGWTRRAAPAAAEQDSPFVRLLGQEAWLTLPPSVRRRFLRRVTAGACVTYVGEVAECRISATGRVLANFARLVGAPLPLHTDIGVPACVSVTEDMAGGGQYWTRQYGRRDGFPQVIHSAKRFAGPTGIEEYLGIGLGIALRLSAEDGALVFRGDHLFIAFGRRLRLRLPRWLNAGALTVAHVDRGGGRFAFTLDLIHPWFGELIHQVAVFADGEPV